MAAFGRAFKKPLPFDMQAIAPPVMPREAQAPEALPAGPPLAMPRGGVFGRMGRGIDWSKAGTFLTQGTEGIDRNRKNAEQEALSGRMGVYRASLPQDQQMMFDIDPEGFVKAQQTALTPKYEKFDNKLLHTNAQGGPRVAYEAPKDDKIYQTSQTVGKIGPDGNWQTLFSDPSKKGKGGGGLTVDEHGNVIVGDGSGLDALTINRYALASNRITNVMQKNPAFKAVISGAPYLDRIEAAIKHPGSVGDQEILDAFTQLNNGGGRVTEAQVHLITQNQSLGDWMNKVQNKLRTGGALSQQQRNEIVKLSQEVYKNYQNSYKPMYEQAAKQLAEAGIPRQFWTIPDPKFLTRNAADVKDEGDGTVQSPKRLVFNPATGDFE